MAWPGTEHPSRTPLARRLAVATAVALVLAQGAAPALAARHRRSADPIVTGTVGEVARAEVAGSPSGPLSTALRAYRRGDLAGGDAAAARLSDPAARAAAAWAAIRIARGGVGFARIAAFLHAYPDWPGSTPLRRIAEAALLQGGTDPATVRGFFADRAPLTAEGLLALALAREAGGDRAGAATLVRETYRTGTLTPAMEATIADRFHGVLGRADHVFRAERLLYRGADADALRAAAHAGPDVSAAAQAFLSVRRDPDRARAALSRVPAGARTLSIQAYALASGLRRSGHPEAAAEALRLARPPEGLVDPDAWWTERRAVARGLLDAGKAGAAYALVTGQAGGSAETRLDAAFQAGWIALRFLGDARTAGRHFASLTALAERPVSLARGRYWQGRAAEAAGDGLAARGFYAAAARDSTTYYGQIARARLGLSGAPLREAPAVTAATRRAFSSSIAVRAAGLLYAAHEDDLARSLVGALAERLDDGPALQLLGELCLARHDARGALAVGRSAVQRGFALEGVAFTTGSLPRLQPVGEVERAVVYGIARQESGFAAGAISKVGARGLMQLMPATAKATARAAGLRYDAGRLASDPAYNARIGAEHLDDLLDRYDGSYVLAFAAYNAGATRVAQWIAAYGDPRSKAVDPIDWVERIPYAETRNYVQRVMENVQVYRARLGGAGRIDRDLRRGEPG